MASKETAVQVAQENNNIESFILKAIETNVPIETLEKLFALREKVKQEQAKAAFVTALATFQENCPIIKKTKKVMNKDGRTVRYTFAPIDSIVDQVKKPLANAQLSYRWETKQELNKVTAICIVTHALGHSESTDFTVEIDTEGYMTAPQKTASALTFAKRYSFCNGLGISTGDEDTDATDVNKEKEALSPKSKIIFLLKRLKKPTDNKQLVETAVTELTKLELTEPNYPTIIERLEILVSEIYEDTEIR